MNMAIHYLTAALEHSENWEEEEQLGVDDAGYLIDLYLEGNVEAVESALALMTEEEATWTAMVMHQEIKKLLGEEAASQFLMTTH
jgi:hypothetical protein